MFFSVEMPNLAKYEHKIFEREDNDNLNEDEPTNADKTENSKEASKENNKDPISHFPSTSGRLLHPILQQQIPFMTQTSNLNNTSSAMDSSMADFDDGPSTSAAAAAREAALKSTSTSSHSSTVTSNSGTSTSTASAPVIQSHSTPTTTKASPRTEQSSTTGSKQPQRPATGVREQAPANQQIPRFPHIVQEEEGNRDWLDSFYAFIRLTALLVLVYFYSSPIRCLVVAVIAVGIYL